MIELPPKKKEDITSYNVSNYDSETVLQINSILDQYQYWSDIKYKKIEGISDSHELWQLIKAIRTIKGIEIYAPYKLHFSLTNEMVRLCHLFDVNFGGIGDNEFIIPQENRQRYLIGSVIEEAISSSQMEGASTTRKVAKEMLRKNSAPMDKSQRMIFNNYQTINFLSGHRDRPLSIDFILNIHSLITDSTLENSADSGRFRTNNEVVVENALTHEVVHYPPDFNEIPKAMDWLIDFVNNTNQTIFIHPVIKAVIIHFFISYLHPFADGNGRTARALFHWYMLKQGYWLTEYMSISRIIYKSKVSYEKSFLFTEADGNDMGYFITYHLKALEKSYEELKKYISQNKSRQNDQNRLIRIREINQRQAEILYMFLKDEDRIITVKDVSSKLLVTPTTAKNDIVGLLEKELLTEISLNRQKKGYIRGARYKDDVESIL